VIIEIEKYNTLNISIVKDTQIFNSSFQGFRGIVFRAKNGLFLLKTRPFLLKNSPFFIQTRPFSIENQ